jgi:hypothetical protein
MPAPEILTPTDRHHCRVYDLRSYRRPSPVSTRLLTDRHALVIGRYGSPDDDPPAGGAAAMPVRIERRVA